MSYQYYDAQGTNYVRPWNNDFTDAEKQELGIGEYRDPATYTLPTAEQEQQTAEILKSFGDQVAHWPTGELPPVQPHWPTGGVPPLPPIDPRMERDIPPVGEHNSWPGNPEDILKRMQEQDHSWPWKDTHPLAPVGNPDRRVPWDGRTPNSWDPSRRFGGLNPVQPIDPRLERDIPQFVPEYDPVTGDRSQRIPVIPYSEEANRNELGFLGKFVEMMKRTGGKLMDKYQQNEAEKREYRENNPGGYPGMPQHLRERLRRNQMSSIDGKLVAGYDPDFPSDDSALREALRGYRRPDGSGPAKLGSDVLDILVRQGRV